MDAPGLTIRLAVRQPWQRSTPTLTTPAHQPSVGTGSGDFSDDDDDFNFHLYYPGGAGDCAVGAKRIEGIIACSVKDCGNGECSNGKLNYAYTFGNWSNSGCGKEQSRVESESCSAASGCTCSKQRSVATETKAGANCETTPPTTSSTTRTKTSTLTTTTTIYDPGNVD